MRWNLWVLVLVFGGIVESLQNESHRILSRKKRWLTFPEGSSLQVVHFTAIPVYGLPVVFLIGVTGAIGYELPYYPLSDIAEELGERIKNGTLGLRHDKDVTKVKYVDKPYTGATNHKYYYTPAKQKYPYGWNNNQHLSFYNMSVLSDFANQPAVKDLKNFWTTLKGRFNEFAKNNFQQYPKYHPKYSSRIPLSTRRNDAFLLRRNNLLRGHRKHFNLLPVLAKRSTENHHFINATSFNERFKMHPIETRHELYSRIEMFLEKKGLNGRECILRSLCQSKKSSELPNTFISEIMKVVFSLPKHDNLDKNSYDPEYYEAHHGENEDCSRTYEKCQHNLWENPLII
ncbi:uncharacterized protein LOC129796843 [Lutzomyia longipalpis]|uniref:uncharacterized protein LOC129796843 n=1 Tax=Lutzomyia longipalpis TaxID=7200 RepID=UPI00248367E5|nr:uncharacterized protein LOC129796843 [Lutzomyia longipalpis]